MTRNNMISEMIKMKIHPRISLTIMLFCLGLCQTTAAQTKHPYASNRILSEAKIFAEGIVSTENYEFAPAFTPDGQTIYYNITSPTENFHTIVESRFVNGRWSKPKVASFSGQYSDLNAFVSPDGSTLFFSSHRPVQGSSKRDANLWMVKRTENGWSEPINLGAPINTEANENSPSVTADGTLYFMSNRKGTKGGLDIYRSKLVNGKFGEPENLGDAINTERSELECTISPDERFLIFAADRSGGLGGADLYISYIRNGAWTTPVNLGAKVNSPAWDSWARLSPDAKYLFFASKRVISDEKNQEKKNTYQELMQKYKRAGNGFGDIYQISISALNIEL